MNGVAGNSGTGKITEKLGLEEDRIYELKLGPTILNNDKSTAFHTIKYDFKPASVDTSKMATVDVGEKNTMTVTVPHLDGAGIPHTVFKGSQRGYQKECVLIIDKDTGTITLERLTCNVQVKKTRSETKSQPFLTVNPHTGVRPITPIDKTKSPTHGRTKSRTKVTSGKKREPSHQLRPKQSPQRASYHGKSPPMKSPNNISCSNSNIVNSSAMPSSSQSLASLPMICENDDFPLTVPAPSSASTSHSIPSPRTISPVVSDKRIVKAPDLDNEVGILSDSSSSSSSSDSSDSDSEEEKSTAKVNGYTANGTKTSPILQPMSMPEVLLNEDLQLSESESDSD